MTSRVYSTDYLDTTKFGQEQTGPVYDKLKDHLNSIKRNEVASPVQYIMKSMENNEKAKNDHNKDVANQLEELLNHRDLTREQRRAMLMAVDERKLVINPMHLDPVLGAYEKINNTLKIENESLRKDVSNLSDSVNLLLSDNQKLREFLDKKNSDLHSVLETVSENEGELVQSLQSNLNLLTEENKALNYEISMLKDLRLKDKSRIDDGDERLIQDKRVLKKTADDLADANLRNQALDSQLKIYEAKLKNVQADFDEECRKREGAEKRIINLQNELASYGGYSNTTASSVKPGEIAVPWTQKANSIKQQEKLEQENVYLLNEKNEYIQKIISLEQEIRKRDERLRDEETKFKDLEKSIEVLKADNINLIESSSMLKKKVLALSSGNVTGIKAAVQPDPSMQSSNLRGASIGDPSLMLTIVEQENVKLKKLLEESEKNFKIQCGQLDNMHSDLVDNLTKENRDLKTDKKNLLAKIKQLMERKPGLDPNMIMSMTEDPNMIRNFNHDQLVGNPFYDRLIQDNELIKRKISELERENFELQKKGLDANKRDGSKGLFGGFADYASEPSPRRDPNEGFFNTRSQKSREPSPIDDIVEKINSKQASRGNSPHTIERYFREGGRSGMENVDGCIDRKKENKMFSKSGGMMPPRGPGPQTAWGGVPQQADIVPVFFPNDYGAQNTQGFGNSQRPSNYGFQNYPNAAGGQPGSQQAIPMQAQANNYGNFGNQIGGLMNQQGYLSPNPPANPNLDQSIGSTSNLRTNLSQISQGFRAEQPPQRPENRVSGSSSPLDNFRR